RPPRPPGRTPATPPASVFLAIACCPPARPGPFAVPSGDASWIWLTDEQGARATLRARFQELPHTRPSDAGVGLSKRSRPRLEDPYSKRSTPSSPGRLRPRWPVRAALYLRWVEQSPAGSARIRRGRIS